MKKIFKSVCALVVMSCFFFCAWVFSEEKVEQISVESVEITTETLPSGYLDDDYSTLISAKGGSGEYRFGSEFLPSFLSLKKSGQLKGRLTATPGEYRFAITVSDKVSPAIQTKHMYSLIIYPAQIISKMKPAPATIGSAYHTEFEIKGGSGPMSITANDLPDGLTMDEKGVLSGTPLSKPGKYHVRIDVKDNGPLGKTVSQVFMLTLFPALTVMIQDSPPVLAHGSFKTAIEVDGGSGDYEFSSPDLPACFVFGSSGVIKGSADLKRGIYPFTVNVKDKATGIGIGKKMEMKVVDFYKDGYESLNDGGFKTENIMKHSSGPQIHTFDEPGDRDMVKLDLTDVEKDSVLLLKSDKGTQPTHVTMTVYAENYSILAEKKDDEYPQVFFKCENPGIYYVSLETGPDETGDCTFSKINLGQAVSISSKNLKDVSRFQDVQQKIAASYGSGSYRFTPLSVPDKLELLEDGTLKGRLEVGPGVYPVKIRVEDRVFRGITDEREYLLKVVDFFPDDYERKGDNDFSTLNIIKPGEADQNHTFNTEGDEDMVRLDLSQMGEKHVIHIETLPMTRPASTSMILYNNEKNVMTTGGSSGSGEYAHMFMENNDRDHVFIKINERNGRTGDYTLKISDKGHKVELVTSQMPDALSHGPYSFQIKAEKGSGLYSFSAENLPGNLAIDRDGKISGDLDLASGSYSFQIRVDDTGYTGTSTERKYTLNVVDYFPDKYESPSDKDFETTCRLTPGDETQNHTFHEVNDVDMIQLNLNECKPNDVIRIDFPGALDNAELAVDFYDTSKTVISSVKRENPIEALKIVYCCKVPGIYYIRAKHLQNRSGEYSIRVDHCGPKVELTGSVLTRAESAQPYSTFLETRGGSSLFVYKMVGGDLPKGLYLDEKTGQIHGKNESWGHYSFKVMANDRSFTENNDIREYHMDAFMGKKITGTEIVEFPHYVSGVFNMDDFYSTTTMFPGKIEGGTQGNLYFSISSHNIPSDRFEISFDAKTGELKIKEKRPVSCSEYIDTDIFADIDVTDKICPNNTFRIRYTIPVRCLNY